MRQVSNVETSWERRPLSMNGWAALVYAGILVVGAGCSNRPSRIEVPAFDPPKMTAVVLDKYDADHDGSVTQEELVEAPGIGAAFEAMDKNGDGKVNSMELEEHLKAYSVGRIGLQSLTCFVNLNGQPVNAAVVDFVPEEFMEDIIQPARAVTNARGSGPVLPVESGALPGVAPGMYRVKISLKNGDREMLPSKYNSETTLGFEVGNANGGVPAVFDLSR